jgi:glycosyltransferase involved in cell wall biosynthesis
MKTNKIPFSIILPAYNEEKVIVEVLASMISASLAREIIVVDDGSTDRTGELVLDFIRAHRRKSIQLISHPYHKGDGASLKSGVRAARTAFVMFFDADGQHRSEDIEALAARVPEFDMVVGQRVNSGSPLIRRPGTRLLRWISQYLAGRKIPDLNSGFRIVRKEAVERFMHILPNGFSFTTTITLAMFEAGYSVTYVPIEVRTRDGKSTVRLSDAYRMLLLILRTITLFNPLKVFLPAAVSLFLLGGLLFVRDALRFDITLKTVMILLSSVIVFFFGLLSDQVSLLRKERNIVEGGQRGEVAE